MERYCGTLKRALSSRSQPWRNLDEYVKDRAYIDLFRVRYNLQEELDPLFGDSEEPSTVEKIFDECKYYSQPIG